jgi:hypothetical protein
MKLIPVLIAVAWGSASGCWAARCTTVLDSGALREYEMYVAASESAMAAKFETRELSWVPDSGRIDATAKLLSGKLVRWNISDPGLNQRIAGRNGTVIDWVGAVLIRRTKLADLRAVLEDYGLYASIYRPMIFESQAKRTSATTFDAIFGLYNKFRFASLFPQQYSFRMKARIDYSEGTHKASPDLLVHLRSDEIRESDSGVPGKTDYLEPHHDHGIMWALNSWWRAREQGPDLYLEFETITLARSVQEFACKLGIIPVPKSIIAAVMDALPAESLESVLAGTKAECERRASERAARTSPE